MPTSPDKQPVDRGLNAGRVEALADGVSAVAMTLLILDLRLPNGIQGVSSRQLAHLLFALWPQAVCYAMSFVTIGALWVAHRTSFHYIRRTDRPLLWINILLLIFVTTIPFVTSVVAQFPTYTLPVVLYGIDLIFAVGMLYWNWKHATNRHNLVSPGLRESVIRTVSRRIAIGPVFYLLGIGVSHFYPWISIAIYASVPIAYAFPGAPDQHWLHPADVETNGES